MKGLADILRTIRDKRRARRFPGSRAYWERRYARGGDSGSGSQAHLAQAKAQFLNEFVERARVRSVVELGCGDGTQLELFRFPSYTGIDVAQQVVLENRQRFRSEQLRFLTTEEWTSLPPEQRSAELALSLDVLYHLVEDDVFEEYLRGLFSAGSRYVIVYASNWDESGKDRHVRHRRFTDWVDRHISGWKLKEEVPNRFKYVPGDPSTSPSSFFVYERIAAASWRP